MRNLLLLSIIAVASFACSSPKPAEPQAQITPKFSMQEIMQSMVEPTADVLWNAVQISVTQNGTETSAPQNDEEWQKVRHEAVTLSEAMNLILMPGRRVVKPGGPANNVAAELSPEQIETLISQDPDTWGKMARALQVSVDVAIQAIDKKDAEGLSEAGGGLDEACETCHKKYWYPDDKGPAEQK